MSVVPGFPPGLSIKTDLHAVIPTAAMQWFSPGSIRLPFAETHLGSSTSTYLRIWMNGNGTGGTFGSIMVWVDGVATEIATSSSPYTLAVTKAVHSIVIRDGAAQMGGDGSGAYPSGVSFAQVTRIESDGPLSVVTQAMPTDIVVLVGDSILQGYGATVTTTGGTIPLLRDNNPTKSVCSFGAAAWSLMAAYHLENSLATLAGQIAATLVSSGSKVLCMQLGRNDAFNVAGVPWASPTAFATAYASLLTQIHALVPTVRIYCGFLITQTTDATVAPYRTAIQTSVSGLSYVTYIDGPTQMSVQLLDGAHPNNVGQQEQFYGFESALDWWYIARTFAAALGEIALPSQVTVDGANNVSSWADATGHARPAAEVTNKPVFHASGGPGGWPYIEGGQAGATRLRTPTFVQAQPYTRLCLLRWGNLAGTPAAYDALSVNTGKLVGIAGGTYLNNGAPVQIEAGASATAWKLYEIYCNGAATVPTLNGVSGAAVNAGASALDGCTLFNDGGGTVSGPVRIAEHAVVPGQLSLAQRKRLFYHLLSRGIATSYPTL